MAKKEKRYFARKFLNKDEGIATIQISGNSPKHGVSISISDCNRQITLDCECYGNDEYYTQHRKNVKYKLDLLISELEKARDWMFPENDPEAKE